MKTGHISRAIGVAAHPLSLGAALVLAANALWWQPAFPSWWTGKIGDVAWLVVAPGIVAVGLAVAGEWGFRAWRLGGRFAWGLGGLKGQRGLKGDRHSWLGAAAIVLTGAAFVLVKTVPAANALVVGALALVGVHAKLALDPTDLLALPGLGLAWAAWKDAALTAGSVRRAGVVRRVVALSVAAGALLADSAAPVPYGVVCVGQGGFTLYAVKEWSATGYFNAFRSIAPPTTRPIMTDYV